MNLTITQETESPLLSRKEVKAEMAFDKATPSNEEVAKDIASKTKSDASLVVVKHIYTKFGETKATVEAYVYASKEALQSAEPKTKSQKDAEKKAAEDAKKAAEAPAEAAPAAPAPEAPKEEKKEEKKEEAPAKPAEAPKEEAKE